MFSCQIATERCFEIDSKFTTFFIKNKSNFKKFTFLSFYTTLCLIFPKNITYFTK